MMSKLSDRMSKLTAGITANNADKDKAAMGSSDKAANTGPGIFMKATFGREAAEQARADAEKALRDLQESRTVNIADLVEIPGRKRILTPEEYAELKGNLANHRLINPITIRTHAEGGYEIVAGHNRVQVYKELGRETIDANLLEFNEEEVLSAAFYTNLFSPALTHYEQFKGFSALQNLTGKAQTAIAQESGLSASHISRILSFAALPDESKALLDKKPWILGSTIAARLSSAVEEGRGHKVIEAVQKLFEDDSFTEKNALSYVQGDTEKRTPPKAQVIKVGQKKFADVSTRNGAIALKFANPLDSEKWSGKIIEYIRSEIAKEGP